MLLMRVRRENGRDGSWRKGEGSESVVTKMDPKKYSILTVNMSAQVNYGKTKYHVVIEG